MTFREANAADINSLRELALRSWSPFKNDLSEEHWMRLEKNLNSDATYIELLQTSASILCEAEDNRLIGMAFLVGRGNPTDLYQEDWSYIRFVTVDPEFQGRSIGRKLTQRCIDRARENNEKVIALHTSELMTNARHIYESLGFTVLREIDRRLGKRYWLYKLDL